MQQRKFVLTDRDIPTHFYKIIADMPNKPLPPLHPGTRESIGPEALQPLFPMALIEQEVTGERMVEIPDRVREIYAKYRPTPLYRAYDLERHLDAPAIA